MTPTEQTPERPPFQTVLPDLEGTRIELGLEKIDHALDVLDDDETAALYERLEEMRRCQIRASVEARNYVVY